MAGKSSRKREKSAGAGGEVDARMAGAAMDAVCVLLATACSRELQQQVLSEDGKRLLCPLRF